MSLYQRLGGESAIDAAVDQFYRKMLQDERVAPFFDSVDMAGQAAKQKAFLTFVLGGPANYTGKDMRDGHAHMLEKGLNDEHVDIVISHLGDTLADLGAKPEDIQEVAAIANSVRDDVLGR